MEMTSASEVFRRLDREIWLVTSARGTQRGGLIATSVSVASIALEHPRIIVGLAKQHHTWGLVDESGAFAVHLLREEQLGWVWRFGLNSGRDLDKLNGFSTWFGPSGAPILDDAHAWLDCRVESRLDTGDRTVYLASVLDARPPGPEPILTLKRLLELAPAEKRAELHQQMARGGAIDAAAIEAWRSDRRAEGGPASWNRNGA